MVQYAVSITGHSIDYLGLDSATLDVVEAVDPWSAAKQVLDKNLHLWDIEGVSDPQPDEENDFTYVWDDVEDSDVRHAFGILVKEVESPI
jgi:hypothetical protein